MRLLFTVISVFIIIGCTAPTNVDTSGQDSQDPVTGANSGSDSDEVSDIDLLSGDPELGRVYFEGENRGRCLKCHTLNGEGDTSGWALDDTGLRRDAEWLNIFLDNPRNIRPEVVRMPPYRGDTEAKIVDVIAYLLTLQTPVEHVRDEYVKPDDEPEVWHGGVGGYKGEERIPL